MTAKLIRNSWLYREWEVLDQGRLIRIAYNGRGTGYESILVDGAPILRIKSHLWYVPRFEFKIGGLPFIVDVRVWPWLAIRAIRLTRSGEIIYTEGFMEK